MSELLEVTDLTFKKEVLESEIPVLVDFWAPWCSPCQVQGPILESVQDKLKNKIKFVKLNTDENTKISQEFQIASIPTLIIFKNGNKLNQMIGVQNEEKLLKSLNYL